MCRMASVGRSEGPVRNAKFWMVVPEYYTITAPLPCSPSLRSGGSHTVKVETWEFIFILII